MACILLWSSAVRVHDSQAYRKIYVTRERTSRILELREIPLSFQTGFNLVNAAVACAIPDSISPGSKRCEFESRQARQENYVRSIPLLPKWNVKDPGHSAKSAGGMLHLNTHTSLTQRSRSGLTIPLCMHSVGTVPETSSHATCQGTFGHSRLSSLSHCGLIPE